MSIYFYGSRNESDEEERENDFNKIMDTMETEPETEKDTGQIVDERDIQISKITKISKDDIHIPRPTSDWEITTHFSRNRYDTSYMRIESSLRQNVYNEKICDELEKSSGFTGRKKKKVYIGGKKQEVIENEMYCKNYQNEGFLDWQNTLSTYIHNCQHLILDVATSCGKTYATALCVGHEILSKNTDTALFVLPNEEVMREVYTTIVANHRKSYKTKNMRLCHMQAKYISTFDDHFQPQTQLMCTTVENFVDFITNPVNGDFVNHLKYIVFDEVHMRLTTRCLWWKKFIPNIHECSVITLSATIGNIEQLKTKMHEWCGCEIDQIIHLKYDIRPIPLQHIVYMGSKTPSDGLISITQKDKHFKWLNFVPNIYDLTQLDTRLIVSDEDIVPDISDTARDNILNRLKEFTREQQFKIGQSIKSKIDMNEYLEYQQSQLEDAITRDNSETIYNLLSSLFTHDLAPVMIFNTEGYKIKRLVDELIEFITTLEENDP